jgi:ABC-type branched-subunit amino acid transport system ATPase component
VTGELLLHADDVVAGYLPGIDILTGCTIELREGELVGIIGPNGAGKSTLIKTVFGLVPVRRGRVQLRGEDITKLPAHALVQRGVGYVPQRDNVFATLSIGDNLTTSRWARTSAPTTSPSARRSSQGCSRACGSGSTSAPVPCRAASARCSRWRAR